MTKAQRPPDKAISGNEKLSLTSPSFLSLKRTHMNPHESKRAFLKKSLTLGLGLPVLGTSLWSCDSNKVGSGSKPLKILILGGTSFLGPHQVAYAVNRGHQVSTFTRGKTQPTVHKEAFDKVEMLIGDRQDNLKALENREWDVVIDNSGRFAQWTKDTAELLKDKVGMYLYVSSTGVYYPHTIVDADENTPVLMEDPPNAAGEQPERDSFGVMKAKSEQEALKAFGADRTTVVRPTYMLGPADRTERSIYWPMRLNQGGEILVPGKADDPVQHIDVRDVAEWIIRLVENKTPGTFNAVGPESAQNIREFVNLAGEAFKADRNLVYVDDYDFLKAQNLLYIIPWIIPTDEYLASARVQNGKAIAEGLTFRDLKSTASDILAWWNSDAVTEERRKQFLESPENVMNREAELLEAWKSLAR